MKKIIPIILIISSITGCVNITPEAAKLQLKEQGLHFSEEDFFKQIEDGNFKNTDLYVKAGMNLEIKNGKMTPLGYAVYTQNIQIIELLLKNEAKIDNKFSRFEWTPLICSISVRNPEISELLMNNGASLNEKCKYGFSPLVYAILKGDVKIVELLLNNEDRININLLCNNKTALDYNIEVMNRFKAKKKELNEYQPYMVEKELNYVKKDIDDYSPILQLLRKHGAKTAKELKKEKIEPTGAR